VRCPTPTANTSRDIVQNLRSGTWDLADLARLFGEEHIKEWESAIKNLAVQAREDRLGGLPPNLGLGINQAAEIVSYLPGEEVPEKIVLGLQRGLSGRDWLIELLGNQLSFPLAALALGDRHGTRLRKEVWG
jgi:hypothetical protein